MAAPEREGVEVRVVGARAERSAITFALGMPTQPFSVGTSGQWSVIGEGVGPVHLFLGFDGERVHVVAASPSLPVQIAGSPLGGTWVTAPVPCDIRFGGACLMIRRVSSGAIAGNPEAVPSTVSDGGALRQAAQRAADSGAKAGTSSPPARSPPKGFGSTMLMEQRPSGGPAAGPPPPAPEARAAPPLGLTEVAAPGMAAARDEPKKGYCQSASLVKKITLLLMPIALSLTFLMLRKQSQPEATGPGRLPAASANRNAPESRTAAPASAAVRSTAVAAASVARLEAPSASSSSRPVATVAPRPQPPSAPATASARTPEREALEAVAAGSIEEAARDYDSLATAHPDDPNFKEAARILHAKAGRVH